jgi:alpha-N-arabinofuranosidase
MSPETGKVEWEYDAPSSLPWTEYEPLPAKDDFNSDTLGMDWTFWGTPYSDFWRLEDSALKIRCIRQAMVQDLQAMNFGVQLSEENYRPFIAKRQLQPDCSVSLSMHFQPREGETAGLALVQAMNHQLRMERCSDGGRQLLRVVLSTADWNVPPYFPGFSSETKQTVLFEKDWDSDRAVLRIDMKGEDWTLYAGQPEEEMEVLCHADGRLVTPEKVGCRIGTMLGAFASGNGKDSDNEAEFDWFEIRNL